MANGSFTLGTVAARANRIDVACSRCERRGQYSLSRLVAKLGKDLPMTDLAKHVADCPNMNSPAWERCDVYYPGLGAIMEPGQTTGREESGDA